MNTPNSSTISSSSGLPRRAFLKKSSGLALGVAALNSSGVLTAARQRGSIGANDRIRIGIIGCGDRGRTVHMEHIRKHAEAENLDIVGVCDPWRLMTEQAEGMVREWFGHDAEQFTGYRDLLAMDDLDAVMISSPDHLHTTHLEAAVRAGKHVYCEKPLATEMDKLVRAVDAVKEFGTVVQIGTQLRSIPAIKGAREVYQSGTLGKFHHINECRNAQIPFWYERLKPEAKEEDVDWKEFLGDRPMRPWDWRQFSAWYGYYDFCQGTIPQWGVHFLDMIHFITGAGIPESCVCLGGQFTTHDENNFTVADCIQATWIYPEGFLLTSSNNMSNGYGSIRQCYSDKGVLKIDNWNQPVYSAEGGPKRDGSIRGEIATPVIEGPDHFENWFQCMRTGDTPNAPIEAGYQHAVAALMAVRSSETGKRMIYDPNKREIRAG